MRVVRFSLEKEKNEDFDRWTNHVGMVSICVFVFVILYLCMRKRFGPRELFALALRRRRRTLIDGPTMLGWSD